MTNRGSLYVSSVAALGALLAAGHATAEQACPGRPVPCLIPENVQVSRDGDTDGARRPVTDFSEVHLAIDPTDPEHLLGSSKFFHTPETYGFYTGVFALRRKRTMK